MHRLRLMLTRPLACIEYIRLRHDGKTIPVFGKGGTWHDDDTGGTALGFAHLREIDPPKNATSQRMPPRPMGQSI